MVEPETSRRELFREGITMALYVSVSLQAVVLATPILEAEHSQVRVALTVFLTAIGLLLAHQVAFRMSTRLLNEGVLDQESLAVLSAQGMGGLPVAVIAALPVMVFGGRPGIVISEVLLLAVVATVGYATARSSGATRARAVAYVGAVVLLVVMILLLKIGLGH